MILLIFRWIALIFETVRFEKFKYQFCFIKIKLEEEEEEEEYILKGSNHHSHLIEISHYNGPDNAWKLFKQNPGVFNHFYC